jgi:uncharacterized phosphatase
MKHLYFIRHGVSVMNLSVVFSGRTNTPLAPEGIEQCRAAGSSMKDLGIDCIVSSPIERAVESANIIANEIGFDTSKIILNEDFIERDFGPLEGTPYTRDIDLDTIDGVEHSSDLLARVTKGWEYLQTLEADTVLVVAHGSVGRALRSLAQPDASFENGAHLGNAELEKFL